MNPVNLKEPMIFIETYVDGAKSLLLCDKLIRIYCYHAAPGRWYIMGTFDLYTTKQDYALFGPETSSSELVKAFRKIKSELNRSYYNFVSFDFSIEEKHQGFGGSQEDNKYSEVCDRRNRKKNPDNDSVHPVEKKKRVKKKDLLRDATK
jgi:hypothetical protein